MSHGVGISHATFTLLEADVGSLWTALTQIGTIKSKSALRADIHIFR
jgi:hypothetical protein